ncbi:molybdopterin-synthase adenylyltransferase MoeB [Alteromonas sp. ASW11-36]|uniref:Molybdopterin-synthase adenylyltransferase MoeB n=1 Tax=Alteromonas arenosi TaxID=3055817 RepID=A0ABT7SUR5_9ALTE|nr:molybdopterin-synthase adenylyltransferase MoeB [Alteromonas sp. ASW11-36]MDM7859929.1 molybdopterin-synthase adenylyltransferase MoeB [Alteromonas sp. ASW11-36]
MTLEISTAQAVRYSRQINLPGIDLDGQERLLASRVLIIGIGGLGCAAAQYLATSGVGHLTLVDDDVVEVSNLQRQVLHSEATLGMLKVDSAKQALEALRPDLSLATISERLDEMALAKQVSSHDVVLDCTDNLISRNVINSACVAAEKPLVIGAAIRMEGHLFSVIPKQNTACYACLSRFFAESDLSCAEAGVLAPVVGIVGAAQALEAIKLLLKLGEPTRNGLHVFDARQFSWQRFNVTKQADCKVCS